MPRYKFTQESGADFKVVHPDKSDAQEDTNQVRQVLDDLGNLLVHSKRDGSYPKDGTTGGNLAISESQLNISNIVFCSDYANPDDAITAIASANKTLLVTEAEVCDTNFTVPANVTVRFERGGKWTINNGITVTFNGQISAGLWQIFAYTGTGTLAGTINNVEIYPQWWGASPSASAAVNAVAFANTLLMGRVVRIPEGSYNYDTNIEIPANVLVEGDGEAKTELKYTGSESYAVSLGGFSVARDLRISQTIDRTPERAGLLIGTASNRIYNVGVRGFKYGIKLEGDGVSCVYNELYLSYFYGNFYDIYLVASNNGWCNENHFWGGHLSGCADADSYCIYISHYATHPLNGNKFHGVAMETTQKGVYCDGTYNAFLNMRYETTGTNFHFGSNSQYNLLIGEKTPTIVDDSTAKLQTIIAKDKVHLYGITLQENLDMNSKVIKHTSVTIADGDATPDISGGEIFITSANTGATEITDLDNPTIGQVITIMGGSDTNASTITDAYPFVLSAGWTAGLWDTLTLFVQSATRFVEISRSVN
jgi:hypothetical protein